MLLHVGKIFNCFLSSGGEMSMDPEHFDHMMQSIHE